MPPHKKTQEFFFVLPLTSSNRSHLLTSSTTIGAIIISSNPRLTVTSSLDHGSLLLFFHGNVASLPTGVTSHCFLLHCLLTQLVTTIPTPNWQHLSFNQGLSNYCDITNISSSTPYPWQQHQVKEEETKKRSKFTKRRGNKLKHSLCVFLFACNGNTHHWYKCEEEEEIYSIHQVSVVHEPQCVSLNTNSSGGAWLTCTTTVMVDSISFIKLYQFLNHILTTYVFFNLF